MPEALLTIIVAAGVFGGIVLVGLVVLWRIWKLSRWY